MRWEMFDKEANIERYPIPQGWIVKTGMMFNVLMKRDQLDKGIQQPVNGALCLVVVEDPEHKWKLPEVENASKE